MSARIWGVAHFGPELFEFLTDLRQNNDRAWFSAHHARYAAAVEAPMLQFITDVGARLAAISPAFRAIPRRMGGSLYRMQRDTRFSPDKSPYKPWTAAIFRHRSARKGHQHPAFYLHLAPDHNFGGGGLYHPDQPVLTQVRQYMAGHIDEWRAVRNTGIEIQGDRLTRVPAGFDRSHRLADDLKLKSQYTGVSFSEAEVTSDDFLERYMECCATSAPLVRFLTRALDLSW